jgi:putative inorganic carbon (hco3(-)) transporter
MSVRAWSAGAVAGSASVGLAIAAVAVATPANAERATQLYIPALAIVAAVSFAVIVWLVDPAYTLSATIFLTPLAGNWPQLGVPGPLSPDRLLGAGAILAVLLRAPPIADRPRLRLTLAHGVLALAMAYALASAFAAGTLTQNAPFLKLVDAFGIMPFLIFLAAPLAFRTSHQRRVLLGTLVALGAYLGFNTLFQMSGLHALVWPKYILDPGYGIHVGRGRGPFVDAVANGIALYTCAIACAIAAASWRTRSMRALAIAVGLLCMVGCLLTLERSVWIGVVLGTSVAMLVRHELRRHFLSVVAAVAVAVGTALVVIPGLSEKVSGRAGDQGTIWDRQNLARTSVNMIETKPLFGFGWSTFISESRDYYEQALEYPLTATDEGVHNVPLTYAVELGLVGMTLWVVGVLIGIGGALATRGPPDLEQWRLALLALVIASLVVINSVPPSTWLNRSIWLLAAVVYSGRYIVGQQAANPA